MNFSLWVADVETNPNSYIWKGKQTCSIYRKFWSNLNICSWCFTQIFSESYILHPKQKLRKENACVNNNLFSIQLQIYRCIRSREEIYIPLLSQIQISCTLKSAHKLQIKTHNFLFQFFPNIERKKDLNKPRNKIPTSKHKHKDYHNNRDILISTLKLLDLP